MAFWNSATFDSGGWGDILEYRKAVLFCRTAAWADGSEQRCEAAYRGSGAVTPVRLCALRLWAREQHSDLIVTGTVGLSGLERLVVGSTTERVLRKAPCAVLAHRGAVWKNL